MEYSSCFHFSCYHPVKPSPVISHSFYLQPPSLIGLRGNVILLCLSPRTVSLILRGIWSNTFPKSLKHIVSSSFYSSLLFVILLYPHHLRTSGSHYNFKYRLFSYSSYERAQNASNYSSPQPSSPLQFRCSITVQFAGLSSLISHVILMDFCLIWVLPKYWPGAPSLFKKTASLVKQKGHRGAITMDFAAQTMPGCYSTLGWKRNFSFIHQKKFPPIPWDGKLLCQSVLTNENQCHCMG